MHPTIKKHKYVWKEKYNRVAKKDCCLGFWRREGWVDLSVMVYVHAPDCKWAPAEPLPKKVNLPPVPSEGAGPIRIGKWRSR